MSLFLAILGVGVNPLSQNIKFLVRLNMISLVPKNLRVLSKFGGSGGGFRDIGRVQEGSNSAIFGHFRGWRSLG